MTEIPPKGTVLSKKTLNGPDLYDIQRQLQQPARHCWFAKMQGILSHERTKVNFKCAGIQGGSLTPRQAWQTLGANRIKSRWE